jgi:hypothetical protein
MKAVLEGLDRPIQVIPFLFLGREEHQGNVGAHGKFSPWLAITSPRKSLAHDIRRLETMLMMSSPMAFILV